MPTRHATETITKPAEARAAWSKIFDNGSGEFAVVKLRLEPLPGANAVLFSDDMLCRLAAEYRKGVEDGIAEAALAGVLNSGRVINVRVTLLDASYHELDSNRRTFRLATVTAFQEAMRNAGPVLVNPPGN